MFSNVPPQLTTVVNYWPTQPVEPSLTGDQRVIGRNPIYILDALKTRIASPADVVLATRDCRHDVAAALMWTTDDVHRTLMQLRESEYVNSQWCQTGSRYWCPSDAYVVNHCKTGHEGQFHDVYLKFGLGATGKLLLVVSCHPASY